MTTLPLCAPIIEPSFSTHFIIDDIPTLLSLYLAIRPLDYLDKFLT